jgi:hypothetical protein
MNEDERGITPPNVTAMTLEHHDGRRLVTIEQGNGDVIKTLELTPMECGQLGFLLTSMATLPRHVEFADHTTSHAYESARFTHDFGSDT